MSVLDFLGGAVDKKLPVNEEGMEGYTVKKTDLHDASRFFKSFIIC